MENVQNKINFVLFNFNTFRTPEEKQASMLKSMETKATNKLIKEKMERIKSLPADQQLNKIEEF